MSDETDCDVYFNSQNNTIYFLHPNGRYISSSIIYGIANSNSMLKELIESGAIQYQVKQRSSFKPTKDLMKADQQQESNVLDVIQ